MLTSLRNFFTKSSFSIPEGTQVIYNDPKSAYHGFTGTLKFHSKGKKDGAMILGKEACLVAINPKRYRNIQPIHLA